MESKKGQVVLVKAFVFSAKGGRWKLFAEAYRNGANHDDVPNVTGDQLTMIHEAWGGYSNKLNLWRYEYSRPVLGMVVGWSFRQTGESVPSSGSYDDYFQGYLAADKRHKVIMVQPLANERWLRPIACLEEDIERLTA